MADLARRKPSVRHGELAAVTRALISELRPNRTHRAVGYRPAERPPAHTLFHSGQVEIFNHYLAIGTRQLAGELMGSLSPKMHTAAVEANQLGFRCVPSSRAGYAARKFTSGATPRHQGLFERRRVPVFDDRF